MRFCLSVGVKCFMVVFVVVVENLGCVMLW